MSADDHLPDAIPPSPTPLPGPAGHGSPAAEWFSRLGLSGKLLLFGGAAGVVCAFLPLVSVSVDFGPIQGSDSAMVLDDWRGVVGLLGYLAAIVLSILLYSAARRPDRNLCWAAAGVGGLLVLLALWLLILAVRTGGGVDMGDAGAVRTGLGIGAILNLLAAGAVAAGAVMKAREEKLI
jgi:hypothetical protein